MWELILLKNSFSFFYFKFTLIYQTKSVFSKRERFYFRRLIQNEFYKSIDFAYGLVFVDIIFCSSISEGKTIFRFNNS
ncbi:hypothetical protein B1J94_00360 [Leptospira kirschneri serovar Grippotyphosa]|nr:hypothetical protein B1J94_00360 [Leptospira kirschneri serovar Grippotyphosa]